MSLSHEAARVLRKVTEMLIQRGRNSVPARPYGKILAHGSTIFLDEIGELPLELRPNC